MEFYIIIRDLQIFPSYALKIKNFLLKCYYIAYYNSLRPNGYNITKGGNYTSPTTMSKVDQYDYQGNLIFTYDSLEDAKNTISPTAISSTNIGAACKGDSMSAYGYIGRFRQGK